MKTRLIILLFLFPAILWAQVPATGAISLIEMGILDAPNDTSRYLILRSAYDSALRANATVSYEGIDTLRLAIPSQIADISIPIGLHNDFSHVVLLVSNNVRGGSLFSYTKAPDFQISATDSIALRALNHAIDSGDFTSFPHLAQGSWVIAVTDSTPWVGQRAGHAYGHFRKEILYLHDGRCLDRPSMPYSSTVSSPHLCCYAATDTDFTFCNVTLLRDSASTVRTYLLSAENLCNARLSNISIVTPPSKLADDCAIRVYNCHSLILDSITILGSYSRTDHSGYGILLDNIHLVQIRHLYARTPWGVFGTNNMHTTLIEDSDFDRFDIHCYGRDVTFHRCRQQDSYNQFSSLHGTILYDSCTLTNFTPILIESSYNAYSHFTLIMHQCTWRLTHERHTLMLAGRLDSPIATRPELHDRCLPDIEISDLQLTSSRSMRPILFHFGGKNSNETQSGISHIDISYTASPTSKIRDFILSDNKISISNAVTLTLTDLTSGKTQKKKITHF